MKKLTFSLANRKDRKQLVFKHYKNKKIAKKRAECYTTHNFTSVLKDEDKVIGTIQWYVKEDPSLGLVEFEEFFIEPRYRNRGLGLELLKTAVSQVKNYFKKEKMNLRRIYLFTNKENKASRKVFEKVGFKKIAGVGDLFGDNKEELLYVLKVKK